MTLEMRIVTKYKFKWYFFIELLISFADYVYVLLIESKWRDCDDSYILFVMIQLVK